jgi:hypothetical protein
MIILPITDMSINVTTKITKNFLLRTDGYYQEVIEHWLVYTDSTNGSSNQKLEKRIPGGIYREGAAHEHSVAGEAEFRDSNGISHRLIAVRGPQQI